MKEGITQSEVEKISGASSTDVLNWIMRFKLATRLPKTTPGVARQFGRDNTVELTLIARLIRAGIKPTVAFERVRLLFEQWEHGVSLSWVLFICGEKPSSIDVVCLDKPPDEKALDALDEGGYVYVLINAARLVDKVDAYFNSKDAA